MDKFQRQRGQALILIVFGMIGLIGMTALVIDGGNAFSDRRRAQNAADTSALTAALELIQDGAGDDGDGISYSSAAQSIASQNGYSNDGVNSVSVTHPPSAGCGDVSGPYTGNNEYVQVVIHSTVDTFFAPIIGVEQVNNCVEAIARAKPPVIEPLFEGHAIVGLAPTGCAVNLQGTAEVDINNSGIFVNSDFCNYSGEPILDSPYLTVVGDAYYSSKATINTTITTDAPPYPYPPPLIYPDPTCSGPAGWQDYPDGNSKTIELTPGTINGDFNYHLPAAKTVVSLAPGIYCVTGDVNLTEDLIGTGVLFYIPNGEFYTNGNAEINLVGMTEGEFKGLLVFMPLTNPNNANINGSASVTLSGTIFAPAAPVTINGTGEIFSLDCQVIGYTVTLTGTAGVDITYNDSDNYDGTNPPEIELSQ